VLIRSVQLQHFRCFPQLALDITAPIAVIEGMNGSGKTSVLEALHYACYLRSFRATTPRDLISFNEQNFFIRLKFERTDLEHTGMHELTIGFTDKKRMVKINGKALHSYKELMDHYRIVTLTEDDMELVKSGPDVRRAFVDQAITLYKPDYMQTLRVFKEILANRNALLAHSHVPKDMYHIWTEQLWQLSKEIETCRASFLLELEQEIGTLLKSYFPESLAVTFAYITKNEGLGETIDAFMQANPQLYQKELAMSRTLFGAHLDDIRITFSGKGARAFASRGQQKLIVLLIKLAQIRALRRQKGAAVLLLDDFLTDFDPERAAMALQALIASDCQLIFTVPMHDSLLWDMLASHDAQRITFQPE
jgi:DNA replication and repair protein RecF